jgi:hypothetical protein
MPIDRAALVAGSIRFASGVWFLASGGADAADLLGGMSAHEDLTRGQWVIGLGGAVVGIGVGLWGATRRRTVPDPSRE